MPQKVNTKTIEYIRKMYQDGKSIRAISRITKYSISTVNYYATISLKNNPETGNPFASRSEYANYLARNRKNNETGKKFDSTHDYEEHRIRNTVNPMTGENYRSRREYEEYLATQRINPETREPFNSHKESLDYLASQKNNPVTGEPFISNSDYNRFLMDSHKENPRYIAFSKFLTETLPQLRMTQRKLARILKISDQSISYWKNRKTLPSHEVRKKLPKILKVSKKTIDDIFNG